MTVKQVVLGVAVVAVAVFAIGRVANAKIGWKPK